MPSVHKVDTGLQVLKHDLGYGTTLVAGKEGIVLLNGGPVIAASGSAGATLATFGPQLGVLVGLGLTTALSAALTQMSYNYKLHNIGQLYSEELEAKLGKPAGKLKDKDLEIIAKGDPSRGIEANKTIADALKKARRNRNIGVVLSVIASLASFALVNVAIGAEMFSGMNGASATIAEMATGVVSYNMIKEPLKWITGRVLGLHKDTAHDRISDIERDHEKGKTISREQVFDVFVKASPELDAMIKLQYGKNYDDLGLSARQQITAALGPMIQLDRMVEGINSGRFNATELAFTVEGQSSGVVPKTEAEVPEKEGLLDKFKDGFTKLAAHFRKPEFGREKSQALQTVAFANIPERAPGLSHVERLQQSRAMPDLLQR